jgi:hypothetical protein
MLNDHPKKDWVKLVSAIVSNEGADLGHKSPVTEYVAPYHSLDNAQIRAAKEKIQERLDNKWIIGPIALGDPPLETLRPIISPWFLVPKGNSTLENPKFREIQDLTKSGINDEISKDLHSTEYGSFERALRIVIDLGMGCWMYVIDIAHAYRNIKLQQRWWQFTAFRILNLIFMDTRLPMGSRSSPYLWMQFVLAFMWILHNKFKIERLVDYMDDLFGAEQSERKMKISKSTFLMLAEELAVPIAPEKTQIGQEVEFLGICINSITWIIRFSEKKRKKLSEAVQKWLTLTKITKKNLQSMIGKLIHASIVYFGGGTFTKPLIHKLKSVADNASLNTSSFPEIELSLKWWPKALELRGDRPITEHISQPTHEFWS